MMSKIDKNQAMLNYIMTCPVIRDNPLYFNVANEKDNNNQIIVNGDDVAISKPFVDGTIEKRYTVRVLMYKSVAYNPIVVDETLDEQGNKIVTPSTIYIDENLIDMSDGQELIDWITDQNENKVFPDFGTDCIIESVFTLTDKPVFNGVNADKQSPLAQYSIGVTIEYIDTSKQIWK